MKKKKNYLCKEKNNLNHKIKGSYSYKMKKINQRNKFNSRNNYKKKNYNYKKKNLIKT